MRVLQKLSISSQHLMLISTLYFGFVLNCSFWRYVIEKMTFNVMGDYVFIVLLPILLCIPLYVFFSLIIVPKIAKPLLISFLMISSFTNFIMFKYGILIDDDMLRNVFETNSREASDFLTGTGFMWIFFTGLLPAALLLKAQIKYQNTRTEIKNRLSGILLAALFVGGSLAFSYKEISTMGRNHKVARKIINTVNYIYSVGKYTKAQYATKPEFVVLDDSVKLLPSTSNKPTVLLLFIGETARSANFSLQGYKRKTNPLLEKQDIIYYSDVNSCGTSTAISLPCMFSHLPRFDFNVSESKYTENMLDMLQKAGYEIIWRENDDGCKGVCSRFKTENMVQLNNPKYCNGTYCLDEVLLVGLEDTLINIKQNTIIVMHMMGSHGPSYYNRYPDKFKKFQPTCDTANIQKCSNHEIINTYDNSILYTDYVLSSAIDILKKHTNINTGLIFVSDHGESLGENNIYLHGFPYKFAPKEQIEIPMIVWLNKNIQKSDKINYACLKQNASNSFEHDHLYHSVIGLLRTDTHTYDASYDFFHACKPVKKSSTKIALNQ